MTTEEQEKFKEEFRSIVWENSQVITANNYIQTLTRFDRNDSHKKVILEAIEKRDEIRKRLKEKLKGKTYKEWLEVSKKLTTLKVKLRTIQDAQEKYRLRLLEVQKEIQSLNFNTNDSNTQTQ